MCVRGSSENLIDVRALHLLCGGALCNCEHKARPRYVLHAFVYTRSYPRTRVSPHAVGHVRVWCTRVRTTAVAAVADRSMSANGNVTWCTALPSNLGFRRNGNGRTRVLDNHHSFVTISSASFPYPFTSNITEVPFNANRTSHSRRDLVMYAVT